MAKRKFVIGEILDNDTDKRSELFGYRVGRTCYIDDAYVTEGVPLYVQYEDGRGFRTSRVVKVDESDYGVWIETMNRSYRFDYFDTAHLLQG